ncbi:helix-turn-helix domain-containing protein [Actinomadura parmotrematis]|uniref:Helix-turn-helix transcriptional regulator n=1 Tax=Actinomadura parmotrematis TaxID=2864039 RepID=A0ABS7FXW4_9ACTN|nr:helix-turn-helix transcriptional regulator [Actinomadura parmotrematis]MBW8485271.1 helix-turn-helix transcriptional regulator [Actinomadura parmotrematis]
MAPQRGNEPFGPQKSFVIEMRSRRENAGLSRHKLAEALGCSPQWLAKVENYEKPPSEGLADDLDTFFEAVGAFHRLWEQIVEARKQGLIPRGFRPLIEAEKEANQICIYGPLLIPGLLQCEEYARLALSVGRHPEKAEELVSIRMDRQKLHSKAVPPWLFILLKESVIRDLPEAVRIEQCKILLTLMQQPRVSIQIIPNSAAVFEPSGFQVLSFDGSPDVAYVEGANGHGQMLDDPCDVHGLVVLFNALRSAALSTRETTALIRSIMEDQ